MRNITSSELDETDFEEDTTMTSKTTMLVALVAGAAACVGNVASDDVADQASVGATSGSGGTSGSTGSGSGKGTGTGAGTGTGSTSTGMNLGGLVAHEWGTYTSVQSSIGETMDGMAHEDEALPSFVHGRSGTAKGDCNAKQLEFCPKGVTQKLETPVIYFYGEAKELTVKVDFPKGIISQWYPSASGFAPPIDATKGGTPAGGSMTWTGTLDPTLGDKDFPAVASSDIWAPSRHVNSVPLRVFGKPDESERFIFYRGLGGFDMPFHVKSTGATSLALQNDSAQAIPAAYLLVVNGSGGGHVMSLGGVGANGSKEVQTLGKDLGPDSFLAQAKAQVKEGLVASGLTSDESQAMVDTWERSYFKIPGTRVLYVAPREWTDALLPITIKPEPKELVRTLVGRVEAMTLGEEASVKEAIKGYQSNSLSETQVMAGLGRFAEPKLRRGAQLVKGTPALEAAANKLVQSAIFK